MQSAGQQQNNKINKLPRLTENQKYDYFLNNFTEDLERFTAFIEENYIFVWLDWDGDNLLMDSGIIDCGSFVTLALATIDINMTMLTASRQISQNKNRRLDFL